MTLHHHVDPRPEESAPFHLESSWLLPRPPEEVWAAFRRIDDWPRWWPGIAEAVLAPGGTRARVHVRSPLGRGLAVTLTLRDQHPPRAALVDVAGDLRGTGAWRARAVGAATRVDFVWCVVTELPLIRALRPLGALAHRRVMTAGEAGLSGFLIRA